MGMGTPDPSLEKTRARSLEIADANQRAGFVARACGGDAEVRREVGTRLGVSQGAGRLALLGILLLSVGLNGVLVLAGAQMLMKPTLAPAVATNRFLVVTLQTQEANGVISAGVTFVTNRFQWPQIESTNFEAYVAGLRRIGCPEKTLADIIIAVVDRHFAARQRATRLEVPFWAGGRKNRAQNPLRSAHARAMDQLDQERSALLKALLGVEWYGGNTRSHMNRLEEQALGRFLCGPMPDGTFKETVNVVTKYDELRDKLNRRTGRILTEADDDEMRGLAAGLKREVQGLLGPAQWDEFSARLAASQLIKDEVLSEAMQATPAEARQIALAWHRTGNGLEFPDLADLETAAERQLHQQQFTNAVSQLLGDQRYADFNRAQDHDFQALFELTQENNLPKATAVNLYEVRRVAQEEVDRVRHDPTLDESVRRQKVAEMEAQLQTAFAAALGAAAYENYLQGNGSWITNLNRL